MKKKRLQKVSLANRKPLYPKTSAEKPKSKISDSAKSTITIKGNFVRASRLSEPQKSAKSATKSLRDNSYDSETSQNNHDYYEDENYENYSRSPSPENEVKSYGNRTAATYKSRRSLGSAGSSQRSSHGSPRYGIHIRALMRE